MGNRTQSIFNGYDLKCKKWEMDFKLYQQEFEVFISRIRFEEHCYNYLLLIHGAAALGIGTFFLKSSSKFANKLHIISFFIFFLGILVAFWGLSRLEIYLIRVQDRISKARSKKGNKKDIEKDSKLDNKYYKMSCIYRNIALILLIIGVCAFFIVSFRVDIHCLIKSFIRIVRSHLKW